MGMVGGGDGAFIGAIHRAAARLDGAVQLVCGAFNADAGVSRRSGEHLGLDPQRVYGDWASMLEQERRLGTDERMQFVAIVTPNHLHRAIAVAALEAGFDVLSDKPAARTLAEAREIESAVIRTGGLYALTYTYLGYPMVCEARERAVSGALGTLRRIVVDYPQGWLAQPLERTELKLAQWRTDPERSGPGGCIADIGVHAFNLAEYVTGLRVDSLCADLGTVVEGRRVDDDAAVFLRFAGGARGVLMSSQVATGEENALTIHVYGERAGLSWSHRDPSTLQLKPASGEWQSLRAGTNAGGIGERARQLCRAPTGHPEGFIEAFANLYVAFAHDVRTRSRGPLAQSPAGIDAAVRGMAFIDAALASSAAGQQWTPLP